MVKGSGLTKIDTVERANVWLSIFSVVILIPLIGSYFDFAVYDVLTYLAFVFTVWAAVAAGRSVFSVGEGVGGQSSSVPPGAPKDGLKERTPSGGAATGDSAPKGQPASAYQEKYARQYFWQSLFLLAAAALTLAPTLFRDHPKVTAAFVVIVVDFLLAALAIALAINMERRGANVPARAVAITFIVAIALIGTIACGSFLGKIGHALVPPAHDQCQ